MRLVKAAPVKDLCPQETEAVATVGPPSLVASPSPDTPRLQAAMAVAYAAPYSTEADDEPDEKSKYFKYKRVFDLTVIIAAHLLLLPLWLLLWIVIPLAIKIADRGPVFYTQTRLGKNHKHFQILKFRSMVRNAEGQTGPVWASYGDSRITKVGRVLRKTHLDEMPQIINVVKGDLSLVGPRPERPDLAEEFARHIPTFHKRVEVSPGIAGLAQVRGKYDTKPRNKLRYDRLYIRTMTPWIDVKLLFLSVFVA